MLNVILCVAALMAVCNCICCTSSASAQAVVFHAHSGQFNHPPCYAETNHCNITGLTAHTIVGSALGALRWARHTITKVWWREMKELWREEKNWRNTAPVTQEGGGGEDGRKQQRTARHPAAC